MTRTSASMFVVICGWSVTVWAQAALPIAVDQRVRVWTAAPAALTGRIVSLDANAFEVSEEGRALWGAIIPAPWGPPYSPFNAAKMDRASARQWRSAQVWP